MDAWFARTWVRRGPAAYALLPWACLFGVLSMLRRILYRNNLLKSERLPVPVIVVGNVFVGGTGKTPFTIWLVHALQQAGFHPGVVSRGHGAEPGAEHVVTAISTPQQAGDEPLLIFHRAQCPLVVGRSRVAAGKALLAQFPQVDVIVSDDGLQHYALQRDLEIVLFDARGVGNGWLLPAGPLREPSTRRRDFTVINTPSRTVDLSDGSWQMQLIGAVAENLQDRSRAMPLADVAKSFKRIAAAAGIGSPERFFTMLRGAGLCFEAIPLPDHFDFVDYSFAGLDADLILITEKDAVKCQYIAALKDDPRIWVVPVSAHLDGALAEQIVEKLRGHPTA